MGETVRDSQEAGDAAPVGVPGRSRVARAVLALTRLLFWVETADSPPVYRARAALAPLAIPMAVRLGWLRTVGLRVVGQLWVRYPRGLAAVEGSPRLGRGPAAGRRLPDLPLLGGQVPCRLHEAWPRQRSICCYAALRLHGTGNG